MWEDNDFSNNANLRKKKQSKKTILYRHPYSTGLFLFILAIADWFLKSGNS